MRFLQWFYCSRGVPAIFKNPNCIGNKHKSSLKQWLTGLLLRSYRGKQLVLSYRGKNASIWLCRQQSNTTRMSKTRFFRSDYAINPLQVAKPIYTPYNINFFLKIWAKITHRENYCLMMWLWLLFIARSGRKSNTEILFCLSSLTDLHIFPS